MALTHVCMWDEKNGGRRPVSIEEAIALYPDGGVSADKEVFACELCGQSVMLTGPSKANERHFRHRRADQDKECEDRQVQYDTIYERKYGELRERNIPLRIQLFANAFRFELGFFLPPDDDAYCEKIKIKNAKGEAFTYSFERIEEHKINYLDVGSVPSENYEVEYVGATPELSNYWSKKIPGIDPKGSFFDAETGKLLIRGGTAHIGKKYYLLSSSNDVGFSNKNLPYFDRGKIRPYTLDNTAWYLYLLQIKGFAEPAWQFFRKYGVFLTNRPANFYPIWPAFVERPKVICHDSNNFYCLCDADVELKTYPKAELSDTGNGKLYRLSTLPDKQFVYFGKVGVMDVVYLIKRPLDKKAETPRVTICDQNDNELSEDVYEEPPKKNYLFVSAQFDGKAVVVREGKTVYVAELPAGKDVEIDKITLGTEIRIFLGCDCVRAIKFERASKELDDALVQKLQACSGPTIPITHAFGALANRYANCFKTKQWILAALREGEIPRKAARILNSNIPKK